MNREELTGRVRTHIVDAGGPSLHFQVVAPFMALTGAAAAAGLDLAAVSSFRDFARQLDIWNAKFEGRRPLLDAAGVELEVRNMSEAERVEAILLWSALPGASRHHWGTDVDFIDRAAMPDGYELKLVPAEFEPGGVFGHAAAWLDANAPRYGFFRPFQGRRSGVQPEPWHYSFAPVADAARRALSVEVLSEALAAAPLAGKRAVLERIESLHERFVARIDTL